LYVKLFSSITKSSIWSEDPITRILWVTLMAEADREGYVFGSVPGLARTANLPLSDTERSLARLLEPDPDSSDLDRNPDNEGRRLEKVAGGWFLLNYPYYRDLKRAEDRRETERLKKKAQRHKAKTGAVGGGNVPLQGGHAGTNVPQCPPSATATASTAASEANLRLAEVLPSRKPEPGTGARGLSPKRSHGGRSPSRGGPPPTLEEVRDFFAEEKIDGDPEHFVDYYLSKTEPGEPWTDSHGRPLGDWKAARAFRFEPFS
jgi:hypothetical protein